MTKSGQIRELINRLARLDAAATWEEALNPVQVAALEYLARANRFSRAPSHVADYLGTTRGTMSQTLKALGRKGYVLERRSETDKRSIAFDLTAEGHRIAARQGDLLQAISALPDAAQADLIDTLSILLKRQLDQNHGRPFGICHTCAHHRVLPDGGFCALLSVPLSSEEQGQICHEHMLVA